MPQSLDQVYLHTIFSTKDRYPFFQNPELQMDVHAYLASVCNQLKCNAIKIGGVADHVHLLTRLPRTITIADFVKKPSGSVVCGFTNVAMSGARFIGNPGMVFFRSRLRMFRRLRSI